MASLVWPIVGSLVHTIRWAPIFPKVYTLDSPENCIFTYYSVFSEVIDKALVIHLLEQLKLNRMVKQWMWYFLCNNVNACFFIFWSSSMKRRLLEYSLTHKYWDFQVVFCLGVPSSADKRIISQFCFKTHDLSARNVCTNKLWRKEWYTALQANCKWKSLVDFQLEMQRKKWTRDFFYFGNVLLENIDRFRVQSSSYQIVIFHNHPLGSSNLITCKPKYITLY